MLKLTIIDRDLISWAHYLFTSLNLITSEFLVGNHVCGWASSLDQIDYLLVEPRAWTLYTIILKLKHMCMIEKTSVH